MLDRCQNPGGCRHVAIKKAVIIDEFTEERKGEALVCAYCADGLEAEPGHRIEFEKKLA